MVLAATNRPSELDEAILRRFTQIFEIGVPARSERSKILQVVLKGENVEPNIDYDHIASLCDGFTGSDILELCKQAAFYPIREILSSEKDGIRAHVSIQYFSLQSVNFPLVLFVWPVICRPHAWILVSLVAVYYLCNFVDEHLLQFVVTLLFGNLGVYLWIAI
jgi:SpoVK/Ycf46/Vps4 family AAA+-type ATPase